MSDVFSKEYRSNLMSRIRSTETKPEQLVRKFLFANGYRFRKNYKKLPGKPDVALPRFKTAIFVHGCFWHGHKGCKYFKMPKNRRPYWRDKIIKNKERDEQNQIAIKKLGWTTITVWECDLKTKKKREKRLSTILKQIPPPAPR